MNTLSAGDELELVIRKCEDSVLSHVPFWTGAHEKSTACLTASESLFVPFWRSKKLELVYIIYTDCINRPLSH